MLSPWRMSLATARGFRTSVYSFRNADTCGWSLGTSSLSQISLSLFSGNPASFEIALNSEFHLVTVQCIWPSPESLLWPMKIYVSRSGTPLWLTPATNSYMWWVVYVLSPAATRGGAISADSQHCVLHQPCTCYSFPFSYLFRPMPSFCVGVSFVVCLTCCWRPPLFHLHSVSRIPRRGVVDPLDSMSGSGARDGTPVYLFILISFLFWFWMLSSGVC